MQAATEVGTKAPAKSNVWNGPAKTPKFAKALKPKTDVQLVATPEPAKTERETALVFDYGQIENTKVRTKAQAIARRIKTNIHTMEKNLLANGRELTAIKEDLGHGLFGTWVDAEFHWSKRTAENYIAVASRLADDYHHLTYLPSPTIYRLAAKSVPEEVRFQVINAAKDDKPMSKQDVERAIKLAKGKGEVDDTGEDPASTHKAEDRRSAAAKAMDMLRAELSDFDGFMVLVREAGREFAAGLKEAA